MCVRHRVQPVCRNAWIFLQILHLLFPWAVHAETQHHASPLYQLDFTKAGADGKQWLRSQGFTLKNGMEKRGDILLTGTGDRGLLLAPHKPFLGLAILKGLHIEKVEEVELEWGIEQYPDGASWDKGVNREALMVTFLFGPKAQSDHFYLPDSPYFIGLFLCRNDATNKPFTGKSYRNTGRYVCLDTPDSGTMVKNSFNIAEAYRKWFGTETMPPLTGIGIEVDTSGLQDGRARAYLKQITLYNDDQEDTKCLPLMKSCQASTLN